MSRTAGDTEVREFEGSFRTGDGTELFERSWELAAGAKAAVIIFHGYGEHSGRYEQVAGRLNREGFDVHTYDQRWHGRSPGKRAYITDFSILPKDGHDFLEHLEAKLGKRPRFLMGHSMGGLILAHYAVRHQPDVAGLV